MNKVRRDRKAIEPIKKLVRPAIYEWTGNKAFNRFKGERFKRLTLILRDDEFLGFCSAIGFVEVNWAFIEQQITHWCQLQFVTFKWRGKDGKDRDCPKPYSRKVRFLRGGFAKIPAMSSYSQEGIALLDRADELSETRHDLTHAVITHMESKNGKYMMENLKVGRDGLQTIKSVVFDVRGFPKLGEKLARLGSDAVHFSHRLQDAFLGH